MFIKIVGTVIEGIFVRFGIKTRILILIDLIIQFIITVTQLHSKAPTKEIKQNWFIFAIGIGIILMLNILSGIPIFLGIAFNFPFSNEFNLYGSWIFIGFIILFCIMFYNTKYNKNEVKNNV